MHGPHADLLADQHLKLDALPREVLLSIIGETSKRVRRAPDPPGTFSWRSLWNLLGVLYLERITFNMRAINAIDGDVFHDLWTHSCLFLVIGGCAFDVGLFLLTRANTAVVKASIKGVAESLHLSINCLTRECFWSPAAVEFLSQLFAPLQSKRRCIPCTGKLGAKPLARQS